MANIVLIDDFEPNHSPLALAGLEGHVVQRFMDVWKADTYLSGISGDRIDVMLTDMHMNTRPPRGDTIYAQLARDRKLGREIPSGLVFAIRAANAGVLAAICTDAHHHDDRLVQLAAGALASPLGTGYGMVVFFEAVHYAVPGVCFVNRIEKKRINRICRYRDYDPPNQVTSLSLCQIFELDDRESDKPLGVIPAIQTRPIKDWGKVLNARLAMPIDPPWKRTTGPGIV